ncbi:hypothetical protein DXT89_07080 [Agrobacterium vitis]|uniref:Uncharacterized protein n=1 Tax=Agrobacterium vitis TaxID=373 RepID=A0A7J4X737_AGRVI|nr:hypothetical protein DXT89_07080 [Agrobacterium vitis]RCU52056.1 hypothetical protein ASB66_017915 [Agrobacterium vitis]
MPDARKGRATPAFCDRTMTKKSSRGLVKPLGGMYKAAKFEDRMSDCSAPKGPVHRFSTVTWSN